MSHVTRKKTEEKTKSGRPNVERKKSVKTKSTREGPGWAAKASPLAEQEETWRTPFQNQMGGGGEGRIGATLSLYKKEKGHFETPKRKWGLGYRRGGIFKSQRNVEGKRNRDPKRLLQKVGKRFLRGKKKTRERGQIVKGKRGTP